MICASRSRAGSTDFANPVAAAFCEGSAIAVPIPAVYPNPIQTREAYKSYTTAQANGTPSIFEEKM
jgi:hypothetical protein